MIFDINYLIMVMLPGLVLDVSSGEFSSCPHHDHGHTDPHWWHSPREVQRVVRFMASVFSKFHPSAEHHFSSNEKSFRNELDRLDDWARNMFYPIPDSRRVLATAHSAFNYLCRDYSLRAVPVRGLNSSQTATPQQVKKVVDELTSKQCPTIFPEWSSNSSVLESLLREAQLRLAPPLLADTTSPDHPTYEAMFRYNVSTISAALSETSPDS